ncbi:MAG: DUF4249 domain-containing protein [Saprospiraceae bacterium]
MKQVFRLYPLVFFTLVAILQQTCVDPINFDRRQKDDILVVDGSVALEDSTHTLSLTRTAAVGRSARFPPESGAQVLLLEDERIVGQYVEVESGVYQLANFKPQLGKLYHIDIQLQSGERYTSVPERVPQPVALDSAYFTYTGGRTMTIYARTTIPTQGEVPYLRWRLQQVYQMTDQYCGGLDQVTTCYYEANRSTDNQLVPLLDGGELEGGSVVSTAVVEVPIVDSIFGEITYFTVFQESLTPSIFEYWQKVNTLITQTGSLFDVPPGQIRGNIYNIADPEAPVLGIFYATSHDLTYVKAVASDFGELQLRPFCGVPGIFPNPFPYPQCCNCRFGIQRPEYWR